MGRVQNRVRRPCWYTRLRRGCRIAPSKLWLRLLAGMGRRPRDGTGRLASEPREPRVVAATSGGVTGGCVWGCDVVVYVVSRNWEMAETGVQTSHVGRRGKASQGLGRENAAECRWTVSVALWGYSTSNRWCIGLEGWRPLVDRMDGQELKWQRASCFLVGFVFGIVTVLVPRWAYCANGRAHPPAAASDAGARLCIALARSQPSSQAVEQPSHAFNALPDIACLLDHFGRLGGWTGSQPFYATGLEGSRAHNRRTRRKGKNRKKVKKRHTRTYFT